jgi:ribosomal protein S18 acetylase RimI-like enzyme
MVAIAILGLTLTVILSAQGSLSASDKIAARELVRQRVTAQLEPLVDAQISNALGIKYLVIREKKTRKFVRVGEAMAREHPKDPHLYLFTIGTRKAARGQGLGKKLIRPMLDAADRTSLPCYLENSNPANTGFYVSHGFERMKLFEPGPGAPVMEAMWREPRQPRGSE